MSKKYQNLHQACKTTFAFSEDTMPEKIVLVWDKKHDCYDTTIETKVKYDGKIRSAVITCKSDLTRCIDVVWNPNDCNEIYNITVTGD